MVRGTRDTINCRYSALRPKNTGRIVWRSYQIENGALARPPKHISFSLSFYFIL